MEERSVIGLLYIIQSTILDGQSHQFSDRIMASGLPKRIGSCGYCGTIAPLTDDHIPPKNLFPKPRPSNLISVPCCENCRKDWSKDDEYFRLVVVSSENVHDRPSAQRVNKDMLRSLQRPQSKGFATFVRESLTKVEVQTQGGIYLGERPGFLVNRHRFDRVAQRIIRGLFFEEKGYPVPREYHVENVIQPFGIGPVLETIGHVKFSEPRVFGEDVFAYQFAATDEDIDSTLWLSVFFERLCFVGYTSQRQLSSDINS